MLPLGPGRQVLVPGSGPGSGTGTGSISLATVLVVTVESNPEPESPCGESPATASASALAPAPNSAAVTPSPSPTRTRSRSLKSQADRSTQPEAAVLAVLSPPASESATRRHRDYSECIRYWLRAPIPQATWLQVHWHDCQYPSSKWSLRYSTRAADDRNQPASREAQKEGDARRRTMARLKSVLVDNLVRHGSEKRIESFLSSSTTPSSRSFCSFARLSLLLFFECGSILLVAPAGVAFLPFVRAAPRPPTRFCT